mmetsp:Transcript_4942/g.16111  ORF Transcript_4942/g.16111 Transcript_4942/m.16111 type:complete len:289 (+) Transcript_4942:317-1183(+)
MPRQLLHRVHGGAGPHGEQQGIHGGNRQLRERLQRVGDLLGEAPRRPEGLREVPVYTGRGVCQAALLQAHPHGPGAAGQVLGLPEQVPGLPGDGQPYPPPAAGGERPPQARHRMRSRAALNRSVGGGGGVQLPGPQRAHQADGALLRARGGHRPAPPHRPRRLRQHLAPDPLPDPLGEDRDPGGARPALLAERPPPEQRLRHRRGGDQAHRQRPVSGVRPERQEAHGGLDLPPGDRELRAPAQARAAAPPGRAVPHKGPRGRHRARLPPRARAVHAQVYGDVGASAAA